MRKSQAKNGRKRHITDVYAFDHLETVAFLAIFALCATDNFSARALPPFNEPSLPSARAVGFFSGSDFTGNMLDVSAVV